MYPLAGVGEAAAHDIVAELFVIDDVLMVPGEVQVTGMVQDAILFFLLVSDAHEEFACV